MKLRNATAADVDAIVALVESAYRGDESRAGWTTEADLLEGQRTDAAGVEEVLEHLILAVNDDVLVGCCTMVPREGYGYFGMFAVSPTLQGGGIGALLLKEAEERAVAAGLLRMEMTVLVQREDLIPFYLRRGYVRTGARQPFPHGDERFGRPRRDDLEFDVLSKSLS